MNRVCRIVFNALISTRSGLCNYGYKASGYLLIVRLMPHALFLNFFVLSFRYWNWCLIYFLIAPPRPMWGFVLTRGSADSLFSLISGHLVSTNPLAWDYWQELFVWRGRKTMKSKTKSLLSTKTSLPPCQSRLILLATSSQVLTGRRTEGTVLNEDPVLHYSKEPLPF